MPLKAERTSNQNICFYEYSLSKVEEKMGPSVAPSHMNGFYM